MHAVVVLSFVGAVSVWWAACKDFPNPFAEKKSTAEKLRYAYSINFVAVEGLAEVRLARGEVGQLHLQSSPADDGIVVRGKINTDVNIAFGGNSEVYRLDRSYTAPHQSPVYNMFTLPLYLRHLARVHRRTLKASDDLLWGIAQLERQLMTAGKAVYPSFSKLHVIDSGDYGFDRLSQYSQVSFAGKQLRTNLTAVRKEIDARTAALRESVIYRRDALRAAVKRDFDSATLYAQAVAIYRSVNPRLKRDPQPSVPSFRVRGKDGQGRGDVFKEIVMHVSTLKQARLLLAKTLLRLYEPRYFNYEFDMLGHKERFSLSAAVDDTHRKVVRYRRVEFSFKLSASAPRLGNFPFGQCDFDKDGRPLLIRINLKPVGKGHVDFVLL